MSFEAFPNENIALGGGAGIQSAQFVASKGAKVVITGNCGPNAVRTLSAAGIELIVGQATSVREALENYKKGYLMGTSEPNVSGHCGMGTGPGTGRGMETPGFGRFDPGPSSKEEALSFLKEQASDLKKQMEEIQDRIRKLEKKS